MMYNNEGSETRDLIFEIYIESKNGKLVYFLFKILSLKCGKTKRRNFFLNIFFPILQWDIQNTDTTYIYM